MDIRKIRAQFPVLNQQVNGKQLIYLDNAATTQKPQSVLDKLDHYYRFDNANIHRGIHTLAERATRDFEATRKAIADFIHAPSSEEIIFTKGVTDGVNLVANSFGKAFVKPGDEIIVSGLEHHSNIVPWQLMCEERGAKLRVIPVHEDGTLDLDAFRKLLSSEKVKLVAVNHASNSLGTVNPIVKICSLAHQHGAVVLIDGAQGLAHLPVNVQAIDCDFYVASGHKMYGPTGTGFLYGKREWLDKMPPYQGGGEMIKEVTFEKTTYNELPYKFEAGTPNIADIIALAPAIQFIKENTREAMANHEHQLLRHASDKIRGLDGVRIIGNAVEKVGILSFHVENMHHFDVGQMLDAKGIAVRTGHHCTQPLMKRFGLEGTVRASFAVYNTEEEVDVFIDALGKITGGLSR
ncbi:MAG: cysteine desulfurase [Bacteroidetes bacterium]|nr:cysteine desulfurase [Bacteroidota bacterium]